MKKQKGKKFGTIVIAILVLAAIIFAGGFGVKTYKNHKIANSFLNKKGEKASGKTKDVLVEYYQTIQDVEKDKQSFSLIYLDHDDIPELVVGNPQDGEVTLYSYEDGKVKENVIKTISDVMKYKPKSGKIYNRVVEEYNTENWYLNYKKTINLLEYNNGVIEKNTALIKGTLADNTGALLSDRYENGECFYNNEKKDKELFDRKLNNFFGDTMQVWNDSFCGKYSTLQEAYKHLGDIKDEAYMTDMLGEYWTFIESEGNLGNLDECKFIFAYINDDEVPELFCLTNDGGVYLLYKDHKKITKYDCKDQGAFYYYKKQNIFETHGGGDGDTTIIYKMTPGSAPKEIGKSYISVDESQVTWNQKEVSKEKVEKKYAELIKENGVKGEKIFITSKPKGQQITEGFTGFMDAVEAID